MQRAGTINADRCRFCLNPLNLDNRGPFLWKSSFVKAMLRVFLFQISSATDLPTYVCLECSSLVRLFNEFSLRVEKNQVMLLQEGILKTKDDCTFSKQMTITIDDSDSSVSAGSEIIDSPRGSSLTHSTPQDVPMLCVDVGKKCNDQQLAENVGIVTKIESVTEDSMLGEAINDIAHPQDDGNGRHEASKINQQVMNEDHAENIKPDKCAVEYAELTITPYSKNPIRFCRIMNRKIDVGCTEVKLDERHEQSGIAQKKLEAVRKHASTAEVTDHVIAYPRNEIHSWNQEVASKDNCGKEGNRESYPGCTDIDEHTERPGTSKVRCDICSQSFNTAAQLAQHRPVHEVVRCVATTQILKNELSNKNRIISPCKVADGQRFRCNDCNKEFKQKTQLVQHLKTHRKVQCPECSKLLKSSYIKMHVAAHAGVFRCNMCLKFLATKYSLNKHIESVHRNVPEMV